MEQNKILKSPIKKYLNDIPKISLAKYVLDNLHKMLPLCGSRYWVFDVKNNHGIKFNEIEIYSKKIASYLSKKGFKKGDILFTLSHNLSTVYVINLAVWRLGGIIRGCYPKESIETINEQIDECNTKFIVVDDETIERVTNKDDMKIINLGENKVPGAVSFDEILQDDGNSFPTTVNIDPEDSVLISNTSGSTGFPKGVVHTNRSIISEFYKNEFFGELNKTYMVTNSNYVMGSHIGVILCILKGMTGVHIGPFDPNTYLNHLETYKPNYITMMPFVAFWLLRYCETQKTDFSFINHVSILGSVLDLKTIQLLKEKLPNANFIQAYALSEVISVTGTEITGSDEIFQCDNQGTTFASCGRLFPFVQVKIIDLDTDESLGPHVRGEILVKSSTLMKGYLNYDANNIDNDGWFHTGDIGFYDEKENLYIVDRKTFTYKYCLLFISPVTIECVLSEHKAVLGVGVIGIPNPETVNLSRAFVVLKPGYETTTENDLIKYVAEKLPDHSHLHGGVRFIKELPQNRNGKLDRFKLKEIALKMQ